MRMAAIADDVIIATAGWKFDGKLKHERNDNFVDFEHGTTLIKSGEAKYSADVSVGITNKGERVLYDITDIVPADFELKKRIPTIVTTQEAIDYVPGDSFNRSLADSAQNVKENFILPTETVVFSSEQIKEIDNLNPTTDADIRFSLSKPVEETRDLIAVHNLSAENLLKTLKLKGFAAPSIAITKAKNGWGKFGDVSVIFLAVKDRIPMKCTTLLTRGKSWTFLNMTVFGCWTGCAAEQCTMTKPPA